MALGALEEADSVSTIAAPSTRANHHDLQPTLRTELIGTPEQGPSNLTVLSYMTRT